MKKPTSRPFSTRQSTTVASRPLAAVTALALCALMAGAAFSQQGRVRPTTPPGQGQVNAQSGPQIASVAIDVFDTKIKQERERIRAQDGLRLAVGETLRLRVVGLTHNPNRAPRLPTATWEVISGKNRAYLSRQNESLGTTNITGNDVMAGNRTPTIVRYTITSPIDGSMRVGDIRLEVYDPQAAATGTVERAPGPGGNQGPGGVTVFEAANFGGRSDTFYGDVRDLRRSAVGNDTMSSIRVDAGCRAELFEDIDFRGRSWSVEGPVYSLSGTPIGNDTVSSLKVYCGGTARGATLFEHDNFEGRNETFQGAVPDLGRSALGNDAASSIRVDEGCVAELYTDINFGGRRWQVEGPVYSLNGSPVGNDSVSSLRVSCR